MSKTLIDEMTPEMMRKVQMHSELGAYAASNLVGAYDLFQEFWRVAMSAAPQPAQQEPVEYWNAVEGWVKIDEVREHFDSVGCGTIYKTAGEGRVPLTAAQPAPVQEPVAMLFGSLPVYDATPPAAQRQWVGLTDEERDYIWEKNRTTLGGWDHGGDEVMYDRHFEDAVIAIEAKLKEKNT
jgi:hypothetical protein